MIAKNRARDRRAEQQWDGQSKRYSDGNRNRNHDRKRAPA